MDRRFKDRKQQEKLGGETAQGSPGSQAVFSSQSPPDSSQVFATLVPKDLMLALASMTLAHMCYMYILKHICA